MIKLPMRKLTVIITSIFQMNKQGHQLPKVTYMRFNLGHSDSRASALKLSDMRFWRARTES